MTPVENLLTQALREAACDVPADAVPPLRLPARSLPARSLPARGVPARGLPARCLPARGLPARGRPARGTRPPGHPLPRRYLSSRLLAPLAAAASVLAIAAGIAAVSGLARRDTGPGSAGSADPLRAVPRYYIALAQAPPPFAGHRHAAGIYATATGALVAAIAVPSPYRTFTGVSAAADDRTFALAARARPGRGRGRTVFFLATFSPSRRVARVTARPVAAVPAGAFLDGFALSPDATKLAVAFQPGALSSLTEVVRVVDVATRSARVWTAAQGTITGAGLEPRALTWAGGSTTLAFDWFGFRKGARGSSVLPTTGVRLLATDKPGSSLLAGSRLAVRLYDVAGTSAPSWLVPESATLSGDGRTVAAAVATRTGRAAGFAEFSTATGRLVRKLGWRRLPPGEGGNPAWGQRMHVLWASKNAGTLIVSSPPGHPGRIGILRGGRFTPLPGQAGLPLGAAW